MNFLIQNRKKVILNRPDCGLDDFAKEKIVLYYLNVFSRDGISIQ